MSYSSSQAVSVAKLRLEEFHAEVKQQIAEAKQNPQNLSDEEALENQILVDKTRSMLSNVINSIEGRLALNKEFKANRKPKGPAPKSRRSPAIALESAVARTAAAASNPAEAAQHVAKSFYTGDGLKGSATTMSQMADNIKPIIDNYNNLLKMPYLEQYKATLNVAPIVSISADNKAIMYLNCALNAQQSGVQYGWKQFSSFPGELPPLTNTNNVQMFPYNKDFYLFVDGKVWKKESREANDPKITDAMDNFAKMYKDDWNFVGTPFAKGATPKSIATFSEMNSQHKVVKNYIVFNQGNSDLFFLSSESFDANSKWTSLAYKKNESDPFAPDAPPIFVQITASAGLLYALDMGNQLWKITPDFAFANYSLSKDGVENLASMSNLTANEQGIVVVSNGQIFNRIGTDDKKFSWKKLADLGTYKKLSVASPGYSLDMRVITTYLRGRYIDGQTLLYPIVESLNAFAAAHDVYMDTMIEISNKYPNGEIPPAEDLAKCKEAVQHAKVWVGIEQPRVNAARDKVYAMSAQLSDVNDQLHIQLQILKDQLKSLQATLEVEKETLKSLQAGLWAAIGCVLLGVALLVGLIIFGATNPLLFLGAGALIVGSVIAVGVLSSKIGQTSAAISQLESQIATTTTAINNLEKITKIYDDLEANYNSLNEFWGAASNKISQIGTLDQAAAEFVKLKILSDTSALVAAKKYTNEIKNGATTYLNVLNSQGIKPPEEESFTGVDSLYDGDNFGNFANSVMAHPQYNGAMLALKRRDMRAYWNHVSPIAHETAFESANGNSAWMNIDKVVKDGPFTNNRTSYVSQSVLLACAKSTGISITYNPQDDFEQLKPQFYGMVQSTLQLAQALNAWQKKWPEAPTKPEDKKAMSVEAKKAIEQCQSARSYAATIQTSSANWQTKVRNQQNEINSKITAQRNAMDARTNAFKNDVSHISPPWYVYLGGAAAILAYTIAKKKSITDDYNNDIKKLDATLNDLTNWLNSQVSYHGKAFDWLELASTLSSSIGNTYNTLLYISSELMEMGVLNVTYYNALMSTQWNQIVANCQTILGLIGQPNVRTTRRKPVVALVEEAASVAAAPSVEKSLAPGALVDQVKELNKGMTSVFNGIKDVKRTPYIGDMMGFWETNDKKVSLLDVVNDLDNEYVQVATMGYPLMLDVATFATMQSVRLDMLVHKKLSANIFFKNSMITLNNLQNSANQLASTFSNSKEHFDELNTKIQENLKTINSKLADLDKQIAQGEQAKKELIATLVGDICAIVFAGAGMAVAFGIIGPVGAVLTLAAQITTTAAEVAAIVKTTVDSMKLADVVKTIESLKSIRDEMSKTKDHMTTVSNLFETAVAGTIATCTVINSLRETFNELARDNDAIKQVDGITESDAAKVKAVYSNLYEVTTQYLNIINAQGINV